jgi:hypothetical protein
MPRRLADLSAKEVAVIDHFYAYSATTEYSEYLTRRYFETSNAALLNADLNALSGEALRDLYHTALLETLAKHHPNATKLLSPDLAHRAFAGLKELVVYASETFVADLDIWANARATAEAQQQRLAGHQKADWLLRFLLHEIVCNAQQDSEQNIYAQSLAWVPYHGQPVQEVARDYIWRLVRECLYDGIVGLTEEMSDVMIRARYAISLRLEVASVERYFVE